jgi:hypothetical protein
MSDWRGNYLDPGKRVGDDVLSGNVAGFCSKLGDEMQMVKLAWWAPVPLLMEGETQRLVVRKDGEMPGLQHVAKVPHGPVYRQELPVVRAVLLLCRTQFPGEGEGLPGALHPLLEDGTNGGG